LGSTKGSISDLSAAFGSLSVDAAISKISNKWKKERQTNSYTAGVEDELGHLKKVLNSCMENLSAHLLPSAPGMIMEAVKADVVKQVKGADSKLARNVKDAYLAQENNKGATEKRILRGILAGIYTKKELELRFGVKMGSGVFKDGKKVMKQLLANEKIKQTIRC
jgi:hypothetical protein